jgi:polysaccharide export outer membrane protein
MLVTSLTSHSVTGRATLFAIGRVLAVGLIALAASGCMRRGPRYYPPAQPRPYAQPAPLPSASYAAALPAPAVEPVANPVPAPPPVVAASPAYEPGAAGPPAVPGLEPVYALDSGDRLRVSVFGQDGLTNSYAVDAAGNVNLALIGPVPARGYTTADLATAIADRLRNGYIREPHVTVEVEAYRPFFILGEVTAPGQYPYVANMTVETAVAIAGGYGPRAKKSAFRLTRTQNGQQVRISVPPNFPLKPGDTLTVAERWL